MQTLRAAGAFGGPPGTVLRNWVKTEKWWAQGACGALLRAGLALIFSSV